MVAGMAAKPEARMVEEEKVEVAAAMEGAQEAGGVRDLEDMAEEMKAVAQVGAAGAEAVAEPFRVGAVAEEKAAGVDLPVARLAVSWEVRKEKASVAESMVQGAEAMAAVVLGGAMVA
mmetsp:Transcript_19326/g.58305  ORF Transcript_19326/g.58305 Transcript_19326/m.58305 type:complete len:118 (+) Transcript_19326:406-759(+)